MMLRNKKILIVGAAGLLGTNLLKNLLDHGAKVVATDVNLKLLKSHLIDNGIDIKENNIFLRSLDITNKESIKRIFNDFDDLTGAVNCCYPRNKNYGRHFFDVTLEDFNENTSLNLGSSFLFMQQCAIYFNRTNKPFSLVNISSIYGIIAPKFMIYKNTHMTTPVEYSAIKSGLIHLSKYVTKYVNDSKFRINLVSPGGIFDDQSKDFLKAYKEKTFGKGMLNSSDVSGSIIFLLSPMSEYVNGQNIIVDDGFTI